MRHTDWLSQQPPLKPLSSYLQSPQTRTALLTANHMLSLQNFASQMKNAKNPVIAVGYLPAEISQVDQPVWAFPFA